MRESANTSTAAAYEREIGACLGRGDLAAAAAAAAACRTTWPASITGWLFGSIIALITNDRLAALALIEEPLRRDPVNPQCLIQKAECLLALGQRAPALAAGEAAAARMHTPATLDAVGEFLVRAGEYARALAIYDRAVGAAPRDATIRSKRATIHRFLGNLDRAAEDYRAVLRIAPGSPKALKGLAELSRQSTDRNVIGEMQAALAGLPPDSADAAILHFGLAKSYEDLGEHAASWRHLAAGNRIERSRLEYTCATDLAAITGTMDAFPTPEPEWEDTTGERPIFIVGLPRCGSTLVDRILSSHSEVHSAGETTALPDAVNAVAARNGAPPATDLRAEFARRGKLAGRLIAAEYLALARVLRGERPRFTDKQLTNFLNCALILRAFPQARIVHVKRRPLAACYAIYRTRFNGTYPFAYDLAEIAEVYIGYRGLMAHWQRVLPGRILELNYEELVRDHEPTVHRLLAHVGLPFEPACLEFHRNPAPVITTSSVQVRQPLYDTALAQWKHYEAQLAPVRERLERAGIAVD